MSEKRYSLEFTAQRAGCAFSLQVIDCGVFKNLDPAYDMLASLWTYKSKAEIRRSEASTVCRKALSGLQQYSALNTRVPSEAQAVSASVADLTLALNK